MATTLESLSTLCDHLAEKRNALIERLAAQPLGHYEATDFRTIADLQATIQAAEAARDQHTPKVGFGGEE